MSDRNQDVTLVAGDSRQIDWTITQADGVTPLVLTGAALAWKATGRGTTITKTGTIDDPAAGTCHVTLAPADTASLRGAFRHELQVTDSGGNVTTVSTGVLYIAEGVN